MKHRIAVLGLVLLAIGAALCSGAVEFEDAGQRSSR